MNEEYLRQLAAAEAKARTAVDEIAQARRRAHQESKHQAVGRLVDISRSSNAALEHLKKAHACLQDKK